MSHWTTRQRSATLRQRKSLRASRGLRLGSTVDAQLFIAVSQLVGNDPDQEVAVVDPDTGRVLAYLVPAAQRHATLAAARRLGHSAAESGPRRTLSDVLGGVQEDVA